MSVNRIAESCKPAYFSVSESHITDIGKFIFIYRYRDIIRIIDIGILHSRYREM